MKRAGDVSIDVTTSDPSAEKEQRTTGPRTLTGRIHDELPLGARVLLSPRIGFTAGSNPTIEAIQ